MPFKDLTLVENPTSISRTTPNAESIFKIPSIDKLANGFNVEINNPILIANRMALSIPVPLRLPMMRLNPASINKIANNPTPILAIPSQEILAKGFKLLTNTPIPRANSAIANISLDFTFLKSPDTYLANRPRIRTIPPKPVSIVAI